MSQDFESLRRFFCDAKTHKYLDEEWKDPRPVSLLLDIPVNIREEMKALTGKDLDTVQVFTASAYSAQNEGKQ